MKFLLTALNAKYIHTTLAVYCLKSYCDEYSNSVQIAEYTINNQIDDIIADIYKKKPDYIGFSCYIWNIEMIHEIAREMKKILPETKIWLGGPEVSYDAQQLLMDSPAIDGVMVGEGEETLAELVDYYEHGTVSIKDIHGLVFKPSAARKKEHEELQTTSVYTNLPRRQMDLSKVPFPYDNIVDFENKIIYYETSRGCPYSCSYCLSSIDKQVRFRDIELVKRELQFFLDHKVPQVKFIDRTFNCKHSHSMAIWEYIKEHDNGITNFHFEISADILRDDEIALLNTMRCGLVQLEIGVQSTNPETIEAIHRKMDLVKLKSAVDRVNAAENIHQHLDLIAGLPYEDYVTFQKSFNDVYEMKPNQLQLGFLKVLKGSYMYEVSKEYNIIYKDRAPYEVLYTNWLSYDDVIKLKQIEDMVEVYYNSGQFIYSIQFLEHYFDTPFELYEGLSEFYDKNGFFERSHSRIQRFYILLEFFKTISPDEEEGFSQIMTFDLYSREKMKSRPNFAKDDQDSYKKVFWEFYNEPEQLSQILSGYEEYNKKQISRITHIEHFTIDPRESGKSGVFVRKEHFILFDYQNRNPLNHDAKVVELGNLIVSI